MKLLKTIIILAMLVLSASLATAHHYAYTGPAVPTAAYGVAVPQRMPVVSRVDPHVRIGGAFPSTSFYMTGLRGGIVTHPVQDYGMRRSMSSAYYPQGRLYGPIGSSNYATTRVGGSYGGYIGHYDGIRSPGYGMGRHVYGGNPGLGRSTITSFY